MADTLHIRSDSSLATSPDPIKLQMQAVNSLERVKACLLANEPMYLFAQKFLTEAQIAVEALQSIEKSLEAL